MWAPPSRNVNRPGEPDPKYNSHLHSGPQPLRVRLDAQGHRFAFRVPAARDSALREQNFRSASANEITEDDVSTLDIAAFDAVPLTRDPFDFVIVDRFIPPGTFREVIADFPPIPGPGSHPPQELTIKGRFKALMEDLEGPEFRAAVERKFDLDLTGRPTMYTVRGFVGDRDGHIHTDSKTKIITVLLYLNEGWEADGGRLRLLRSGDSLDNPIAEVSPNGGTLLVFRRSENSWHGHKPFAGQRRAIQLNWVTGQDVVSSEQRRHAFSTRVKKIRNMLLPTAG